MSRTGDLGTNRTPAGAVSLQRGMWARAGLGRPRLCLVQNDLPAWARV